MGTDRSPVAVPAALSVGVGLLLIAAALSVTLPSAYAARNWSLAWTGFDLATAACALLTARLLRTGDRRAALAAAGAAALFAIDAWFDVCTAAAGSEHVIALTEAVLVELPLAVLSGGLALSLVGDGAARTAERS